MELIPDIKSYDWGKLGSDSEVASLVLANAPDRSVDASQPFAEWWIGDHVSGPSIVRSTGQPLNAAIGSDPSLIGGSPATGDAKLPFLLKVLSIRKALSIQVHPSKEVAERLHRERPDLYKDANHKPEIAIALTPFQALCGFRPTAQLAEQLEHLPPLVQLIGADNVALLRSDGSAGLRQSYARLMHSTDDEVAECIRGLTEIFQAKDFVGTVESEIFLRLQTDFPCDVGSLSLFFLNVLQLQPGQAIFLPAREPHAYLAGNCVECMACSDNVIRAGLTPKFKDVEELLEQLNYEGSSGESKIFAARRLDAFSEVFVPSVRDFAVARIRIGTATKYEFANRAGGSILLVLGGAGELRTGQSDAGVVQLQRGSVVFVPATSKTIAIATGDAASDEEFVCYQAMYNDFDEE